MARLPRYFAPGQPQHLIQRGNDRQKIFRSADDYAVFYECLVDAADRYGCAVHAYILMPTHMHLLATPKTEQSLPRALQSVGRRYVQYFNETYSHAGTLWEGRYRATILEPAHYLLTCMRYVELNPVRKKLAKRPDDYFWSSYHAHASGEPDDLLSDHAVYQALGKTESSRHKAYRALFRNRLPQETVDDIRDATNKAWVLGTERFKKRIEKASGRRASPLPKGRPRKNP
jgi:putative transposase